MPNLFKNKKYLTAILAGVFSLVIIITASAAALFGPEGYVNVTPEDNSSDMGEEIPNSQEGEGPSSDPDSQDQDGVIITQPVSFNKPDTMRAVYITPGQDFLKGSDTSSSKVKSEIESAIKTAKSYGMNTVIINTKTDDKVLYKTELLPSAASADFDPLEYAITFTRSQNMFVYTIFDALLYTQNNKLVAPANISNEVINAAVQNGVDLAANYKPDGIIIDTYYNKTTGTSYSSYLKSGGLVGFQNYMQSVPDSVISNLSKRIRQMAPGVQVGLMTDVWENSIANEAGSNTKALFCSLSDGNADTKKYVDNKLVDFVSVRAYGSLTDGAEPFVSVVKWWANVAKENDIKMYVVQASDRICTGKPGWSEKDQIVKQIIEAEKISGYGGSIFNNLPRLIENPSGARELLVKYIKKEIKSDFILTQLTFTRPAQKEYSTYEPSVNFTGASDPNEKLYMDGNEIKTDKNGFFTIMADLKPGKNTFTFKHKDKTETFTITRNVKVLKEVTPSGSVTVNGSMKMTITAMAYEGSTVTANVNGTSVRLAQTNTEDDNTDKESAYKLFSGEYTAPVAGNSVQSLGNITITATWQGVSETMTGAAIKVNKKIDLADGSPVEISSDSAETFPINTLNDLSDPNCFPLAKGTRDYTVGDEIIYKEGSTTFSYYRLGSDQRVYSKDLRSISKGPKDSKITGMTVTADSQYTEVILKTDQKPSYTFKYSSSQITVDFSYTKSVPGNISSLTKNPLFSSATWSGTTLRLSLKNRGTFLGYHSYYNDATNELVLKFNNPPTGSGVSGARIIIDSGHGGSDPGALGNNPSFNEKHINASISSLLTSKLNSMGANVRMIGNDSTRLDSRMATARSYGASMYVAVHCNSASSSAAGSEAYYFYSSQSSLASSAASGCASALGTSNRGAKFGRFRVTRDSHFAATLVETGFLTNSSEYEKLCSSSYQDSIANKIAAAIESYYSSAGAGTRLTGTQSVGETSGIPVTGVTLDKTTLSLAIGQSQKLTATITPNDATNKDVSWSSDNTNIATVSPDGTITAKAVGTAKITVKTADGDKTAVCTVTVTNAAVTGVTLNKTSTTLEVGKTEQLTATIVPDNGANKKVTWSSSASNIATVDSEGRVTAVAPGTAVITVKTEDGGKTATCTVTVKAADKNVIGVTLNQTSLNLNQGESYKLIADITPSDATNKDVTWSTSNDKVASVDSNGNVSAVGEGTATITVTTKDGSKTATCQVNVAPAAPAEVKVAGISFNDTALTLSQGESKKLGYTISPANATNKAVSFSSSDGAVSISSDGTVSVSQSATTGSVVITVTTQDGGKTSICTINIP